jgi:4,5-DOPA dioxygenase extradiol
VLRRVDPAADVPIVQLGIDIAKGGAYHYELASRLAPLPDSGVLVVESGNLVHNLGMVAWDRLGESYGFDWALEINATFKNLVAAVGGSLTMTSFIAGA